MSGRTRGVLIVLVLSMSLHGTCLAEMDSTTPKIDLKKFEGWWVPVGITVGGTLHAMRDRTGLLGIEVSVVHLELGGGWLANRWVGLFSDVYWAGDHDEVRFSIGPEMGVTFFGFDMGYMGVVSFDGGYTHGVTARLLLTACAFSVYVRWNWLAHAKDSGELGFLLKYPFKVK